MQNIPSIEKDKYTAMTPANMADRVPEKAKTDLFEEFFSQHISYAAPDDADTEEALFKDLFAKQDLALEKELATAPVSTDEKMHEAAPEATSIDVVEEKEVLKPAESVIHKQPAEKKMTQQDFEEVRDDLEEYGLSKEEIQELEDKVNSEDGLTWGEFVAQLNEKISAMKKVELSPEQTEKLHSMFAKLGFNDEESKKLISELQNGNTKKVMAAIQQKLDTLPKDSKLLFTKGEAEAFAAAINSSKEFTAEIRKLFAKEALPKDMKEAFSFVSQELATNDQKELRLVRAVGKAVVKAMQPELKDSSAAADLKKPVDLKDRTAKGEKSETKSETKTDIKAFAEEAKASAQDGSAKGTASAGQAEAGKEAEKVGNVAKDGDSGQAAFKEGEFKQALRNVQENSTHKNGQDDKQNPAAQARLGDASQNAGQNARQDDSNQPFSEKNTKQDNAWNQFFSKLSKEDAGTVQRNFARAENLAQALKNSGEGNAKTALGELAGDSAKTRVWEKISAPKVMRQVNNAIFKNLGQGNKQLTLHLKPEALGAVKVMLQVQGKEVNATLRAESADAAKVLAENMESIKQSLENQGLKVNKLEVQTGLADNGGRNDWQGEMQHNQARDRDEMARMRERMRNLRGTGTGLAQDVQNMSNAARVAEQGLHVIA